MGSLLLKLRTWWETADRTQKVVTVFGSAFLITLIGGTLFFASRPKMEMLYGGLSPADQGMLNDELRKQGVQTEIDAKGNLYVPSDQVATAQSKLALAKKLPSSGHAGNADLEKLGMMTTPSVERERLKAVLEGELEKSVEAMAGVAGARVHLVLQSNSPFETEKSPASASITIAESSGYDLGADEARAIAMLVQNSVPGLESKNITVLSSTRGSVVFDGASEEGTGGGAQRKVEAEIAEGKRRERELQQKMDAAFGPGNTIAMVSVVLNFDRKSIDRHESSPSESPLSREVNDETMNGGGSSNLGGLAGVAGNTGSIGAAPAAITPTTSDPKYQGKQVSEQYGVNETHTVEETAPGDVTQMTVNVLVNETKYADPSKIQAFVDGYLGPKKDDPNFRANVTSVPFDQESKKAVDAATSAASGRDKIQQAISILPIVALLIVGFMVVKSITKASKSSNVLVAALPGGSSMRLSADSGGGHRGDYGGYQNSLPGIEASSGPLPSVVFNEGNSLPEHVDAIAEKVNIPLEQLKKMAIDRPDTVAMLLKSWMLDERR